MRFNGRVRFEDKRSDDLDVVVEVDDSHLRLLSGAESLGKWCLADVVANRLVANQFELDLDGEVITFLADDQVNFAYGAVQKMAEGWARYHSMNPVRRRRAVASARRLNEPSRLGDVHRTLMSAREELRRLTQAAGTAEPSVVVEEQGEAEPVRAVIAETPAEVAEIDLDEAAQPVDVGPGQPQEPAGFWARVERVAGSETVPDEIQSHPRRPAQPAPDRTVEPTPAPARPQPRIDGRLPRLDGLAELGRHSAPIEAKASAPFHAQPSPAPAPAEEPEIEPSPAPASDPEPPRHPQPATETLPEAAPEPQPRPPADEPQAHPPPGEDHRTAEPRTYRGGRHPAETSGLRAGIRSLFSRSSKAPHEHSYVQTTTVGITRRVCIECGHVSIGADD